MVNTTAINTTAPVSESIPRPPKLGITDRQIKLVAIVVFTAIAITVSCVLLNQLHLPMVGGKYVLIAFTGMICTFPGAYFVPGLGKVDLQTKEGAVEVRKDLRNKSLNDLAVKYFFSDLAHYGYISLESAKKMEGFYEEYDREASEISYIEYKRIKKDYDHWHPQDDVPERKVAEVRAKLEVINEKFVNWRKNQTDFIC